MISRVGSIRLWRWMLVLAALVVPSMAPPSARAQEMKEATMEGIRVVYAPRHQTFAGDVLAAARRRVRFPGLGLVAAPESTTIIIAPDARTFAEATGGGVPEWAGGVAIPDLRRIVLPRYASAPVRDDERGTVLRHEIAHLVLHDRLPANIPRWFDEGYAEVASGGWDVEGAWKLRVAFVTGGVPPLDSLILEWPRGSTDAQNAYLLSATAVDYIRRRGGERGMELLLANWQREGTFDAAVRTTFGVTVGQLEQEWRDDVRTRYGWLAMLSSAAVIWVIATVLVLLAWIPRRRRNRERMRMMEIEERMLPPPRPEMAGVEYPLPEPRE